MLLLHQEKDSEQPPSQVPGILNVMPTIFPLTKWIGGSGDQDGAEEALKVSATMFPFCRGTLGLSDEAL